MECCEGGDVAQLISSLKRKGEFLDEATILKIFSEVCFALRECHCGMKMKIIHRDLKPANIMLDCNMDAKLADFGLARILSDQSTFACTKLGTPYYMSPEQLNADKYDESCDIWSLGCILYEMCTLEPPFKAMNAHLLEKKITEGAYEKLPSRYSTDLSNLIQRMLCKDPTKRITIGEICEHPLIKYQPMISYMNRKNRMLKDMEKSLSSKEKSLKAREVELEERVRKLDERERLVEERERLLSDREKLTKSNGSSNGEDRKRPSPRALPSFAKTAQEGDLGVSPQTELTNKENIYQTFKMYKY